MTHQKVCEQCNKTFEAVNHGRKYCSIACFRKAPKSFSHMKLSKKELIKLYFDDKLSFYKIEKTTGISVNTLRYWFNKWNLKPRNSSQAQKGRLNHQYKDGCNTNRERAIKRDLNQCVICGFDRILNVHHIKERYKKGTDNLDNLITLCPNCHALVHSGEIKVFSPSKWVDKKE